MPCATKGYVLDVQKNVSNARKSFVRNVDHQMHVLAGAKLCAEIVPQLPISVGTMTATTRAVVIVSAAKISHSNFVASVKEIFVPSVGMVNGEKIWTMTARDV